VWEEGGYKVIGAAVANRAARELQNRAGIESMSVAKLLYLIDKSFAQKWGHHLHMIGREALKMPTFKLNPSKLNERTVLVVDEASMLDTRVLAKLVKHARKSGAMLVLVGDRQQLQSIGPGGAFAHIADTIGKAQLTTTDRQKDAEDKRMVRDVLNGNIEEALKNLAQRDRLVIAPNRKGVVEKLIDDWFEKERGHFNQAQIYAPTRASVAALNAGCQAKRLQEGSLDATRAVATTFVDPDTKQETQVTLHCGDRVMMQHNNRTLDINNGETGTIVKIRKTLRTHVVSVALDRGDLAILPLSDYPHMTLGYATTVHKGQGSTTTRAYNLLAGGMQDREMTNVQLTRATHEVRVYASEQDVGEDLREMASRMKRSGEKTLATQIPQPQQAPQQDQGYTRGR
jgi:ATP-dependent exoDNAse (exonuclease V) alpha subunit